MTDDPTHGADAVAITGVSGRFPGAPDLDRYWGALRDGRRTLTDFDKDELLAAGVPGDELRRPEYVRTKGWLPDADRFDFRHFGFNRSEAAALDPQHRLLLQTAWSALEDAGHDPRTPPARTGVYAGGGLTEHMLAAHDDERLAATLGELQVRILTDREFLAPWISYRLGLDGPSVGVQTACSTSLTAVHLAVQALLLGECDTALAGGVALDAVRPRGYLYRKGGIFSPDGRCLPFAPEAAGTVPGNGVGLVVLRRLEDALADGDPVRAVIRGSAVTNDGAGKVGFTAPGVAGQTAAITEAWAAAGLEPARAQYLEAHGTGTELGDRVELAAAAAAFAAAGTGRIALGSVKANIGHLDAAAGVAALVKTVLMLQRRTLVPSAGVTRPHPELGMAHTPFRLPTAAEPWTVQEGGPRLAGVSSVGIGGTNVHVVLEEAPQPRPGVGRRTARPARVFSGEALGALHRTTGPDGDASGPVRPEPDASPERPAGALQAALARMLVETLGLDGPQDFARTYFEAGGDSLAAVTLVGRIRDEHGIEAPITVFLEDFPLHGLVDRIVAQAAQDPLAGLLEEFEAGE
ncbi:beta-ketoacyl synthase N-terminal-like domain-containing protein [Streptomyces sp. NPDC059467]|uniref:beta-ketoacyl synthase N-terminal-like domain-containing protein n=1 Tax=Streptomyces sp. NPDC059467 TaxID=3346844 RepID=UPI0036CB3952